MKFTAVASLLALAASATAQQAGVDVVSNALKQIITDTNNLGTGVDNYSGRQDQDTLLGIANQLLSDLATQTTNVNNAGDLSIADASTLVPLVSGSGGLNDAVASASTKATNKEQEFASDCEGNLVYTTLQKLLTAATTFKNAIKSKTTDPSVANIVDTVSAPTFASLNSVISAFSSQATPPSSCPASSEPAGSSTAAASSSGAASSSAAATSSAASGASASTTAAASSASGSAAASSTAAAATSGAAAASSSSKPAAYTGGAPMATGVSGLALLGLIAAVAA